MPEDNQQPTPNESPENGGDKLSYEELQSLYKQTYEELKDTRNEAGGHRLKAKAAMDELEALKAAQMEQLEQQGNFKAIADERAKRVAELEPYEARAKALEDRMRQDNDARIAQIPEHMRSVVPVDYPPEKLAQWLSDNASVLARPTPPNLGAGLAGGNGVPVQLTAMQDQIRRAMDMTVEEYAAYLKKAGL